MTKLRQYVEEMRVRLSELARDEQALVQALGDALNRLDQEVLGGVRTIATEHELRREDILGELRGLADSIGTGRQPLGAPAAPEDEELAPYRRTNGFQERIIGPTDWRQAISKVPSF